jgi:hypothetical protein
MSGLAFVSYSRDDEEFALRFAKDLQAADVKIWIDQIELPLGEPWDSSIQEALQSASIVLVILSPSAVESENVLDEVSFAIDEKKTIIPVLYRDCTVPFRLRRLQYVDFRSNYGDRLQQLATRLGRAQPSRVTVPGQEAPAAEDQAGEQGNIREFMPSPGSISDPFLMAVEDVFSISGRGTVATGQIDRGQVRAGGEIEIVGFGPTRRVVVTAIQMSRKVVDEGKVGDSVGLLLQGVDKDQIERGQVLARPSSIHSHTTFRCKAYLLSTKEGGQTPPLNDGQELEAYFRTIDVPATLRLLSGVATIAPGTKTNVVIELTTPVALENGTKFALRQNGQTIGAGIVTDIIA